MNAEVVVATEVSGEVEPKESADIITAEPEHDAAADPGFTGPIRAELEHDCAPIDFWLEPMFLRYVEGVVNVLDRFPPF